MPWPDWASIALCLMMSLVESRRGSLAALFDLFGVMVALRAAAELYPYVISEAVGPDIAYVLVLGALFLLLIMVSWQVQMATARLRSPADFTIGAVAGVVLGLMLGYALFHFLLIACGETYTPYHDSYLRPYIHDLGWLHALAKKMGIKLQ